MVSALLGFMALSGVLGKRNLEGFGVRVVPPAELYNGIEALLEVELDNRRRLPSYLLRIELAGGATTFVGVPAGERQGDRLALRLRGRGRHRLETVRVSSNFPVNFFVRSRLLQLGQELLVFPAPRPCPVAAAGDGRQQLGELPLPRRGQQGEIVRIGDYTGREPYKQIHWKLSARQDSLKVKEHGATLAEPVLIDLALLPGRDLEERLGCAAFLVQHHTRAGRPVGLRLPERSIPPAAGPAQRLRLLRELALYGPA